MPGLSRFSRKLPSTAAPTNGGDDGKAAAKVGDGGSVPTGAAATSLNGQPSASGSNAEQSNGGGDNAANFSSLVDRPSTGGSNTFADFGNMFAMAEQNGLNSNNMLDSSAFLSSTPTEGLGDVGASLNNNMLGDNSFLEGFGSRPSTGEGGNAFQFGGIDGFNAEEQGGGEQRPTTAAKSGNETSGVEAKRPADAAPKAGGLGIGLFAKRRAVSAAPKAVPMQPTITETNESPPKNDGLASAASSVANLSQFDTNLLSEIKTDDEAPPPGKVQIPKSIATSGGDVEDDLTVGTTTSVVMTTMDGVANAQPPAPAAKSPYFTNAAKQSDAAASNEITAESNPGPSKEEIIIPGMNMDMNVQKNVDPVSANVTTDATKQDTVLAPKAGSQRVSLSPSDAKINQASTNADQNSIVIPGVTKNSDMDITQTMVQHGGVAQAENAKTASSIAKSTNTNTNITQLVNGASTSTTSVLANNNSRGMGRFSTTERVKFNLPESTATTKTMATMSRANSTAITPDHRRSSKQVQALSGVTGENLQNAVTPTPHKPTQSESSTRDRVIPGMSGAGEQHNNSPNEAMVDDELQQPKGVATGDSVRSPTPATKNDASTPKASNLNTSAAYSGSAMLATHESFDELLAQLGADLTEATDIHNKGNLDLLHLEVALTHAYAKSLQLKGTYVDFLDEIDAVSSMCESMLTGL